jgi:hypothetical protein
MCYMNCFQNWSTILTPVPDPDPATQLNADTCAWLRVRNFDFKHCVKARGEGVKVWSRIEVLNQPF